MKAKGLVSCILLLCVLSPRSEGMGGGRGRPSRNAICGKSPSSPPQATTTAAQTPPTSAIVSSTTTAASTTTTSASAGTTTAGNNKPNCANDGWAEEDGQHGYVCKCSPGYTGANCENPVSTEASTTVSQTPSPSATVYSTTTGASSTTTTASTTTTSASPTTTTAGTTSAGINKPSCQHGGSAEPDGQNSYVCKCSPEFTGAYCENPTSPASTTTAGTTSAAPQPTTTSSAIPDCQNGGSPYQDKNGAYLCECPQPYCGDRCESTTTGAASTTTSSATMNNWPPPP